MARVVRFHQIGGPEVLRVEEIEVAPPGKGEVQIRIMALGLNRAESMFRRGQYLVEPNLPARLGYEAAGIVAAIGPGVQGFTVGDAVSNRSASSAKPSRVPAAVSVFVPSLIPPPRKKKPCQELTIR